MATSLRFRQLEDRVNSAAIQHLSAVQATLGGQPVQGWIEPGYDVPTLDGYGAAAGTAPLMQLASAQVPARPEGLALVVAEGPNAGAYRVGNAKHDGAGWCTLELLLDRTP